MSNLQYKGTLKVSAQPCRREVLFKSRPDLDFESLLIFYFAKRKGESVSRPRRASLRKIAFAIAPGLTVLATVKPLIMRLSSAKIAFKFREMDRTQGRPARFFASPQQPP